MLLVVKCLLVFSVIDTSLGWWTRRKRSCTPPNRPPSIRCPSVPSVVWAEKGRTTARVSWAMPIASDPEGRPFKIRMKTPKVSGSSFGRGFHTVIYDVTDSIGLRSYCSFSFIVKVHECMRARGPENGRASCNGNIYGSQCAFSCDNTYILVGSSYTECQKDGQWTPKPPVCKRKET